MGRVNHYHYTSAERKGMKDREDTFYFYLILAIIIIFGSIFIYTKFLN